MRSLRFATLALVGLMALAACKKDSDSSSGGGATPGVSGTWTGTLNTTTTGPGSCGTNNHSIPVELVLTRSGSTVTGTARDTSQSGSVSVNNGTTDGTTTTFDLLTGCASGTPQMNFSCTHAASGVSMTCSVSGTDSYGCGSGSEAENAVPVTGSGTLTK